MSRFTKNEDGTVTDTSTGLIWSQTLLDGNDAEYEEVEKAIAALGDGWRFPTVDELSALVDRSRYSPAIDTEAFPDTKNDLYWTSTPCAWNDSAVWVVDFLNGYVDGHHRYSCGCVRAVRSSQ